jgi:hypothetical protein
MKDVESEYNVLVFSSVKQFENNIILHSPCMSMIALIPTVKHVL